MFVVYVLLFGNQFRIQELNSRFLDSVSVSQSLLIFIMICDFVLLLLLLLHELTPYHTVVPILQSFYYYYIINVW